MAATEFNLFRIKFIRSAQQSFLHDVDMTPSEFFTAALNDRPSLQIGGRFVWHIGNLAYFTATSGYFAVGRTAKKTVDQYDETTKNFVEVDHKESPYAHCLFDSEIGIVVISRNNSLCQKVEMIADKIVKLLSKNQAVVSNQVRVEVVAIPDPEGFVEQLSSAINVTRFTASFAGPNPFDADEYFQRPMSVFLASAGGEEGSTTIKGESLDNETLVAVSRSTAAIGGKASARIRRNATDRNETIHLDGDPVKRSFDLSASSLASVLEWFRRMYRKIRGGQA